MVRLSVKRRLFNIYKKRLRGECFVTVSKFRLWNVFRRKEFMLYCWQATFFCLINCKRKRKARKYLLSCKWQPTSHERSITFNTTIKGECVKILNILKYVIICKISNFVWSCHSPATSLHSCITQHVLNCCSCRNTVQCSMCNILNIVIDQWGERDWLTERKEKVHNHCHSENTANFALLTLTVNACSIVRIQTQSSNTRVSAFLWSPANYCDIRGITDSSPSCYRINHCVTLHTTPVWIIFLEQHAPCVISYILHNWSKAVSSDNHAPAGRKQVLEYREHDTA